HVAVRSRLVDEHQLRGRKLRLLLNEGLPKLLHPVRPGSWRSRDPLFRVYPASRRASPTVCRVTRMSNASTNSSASSWVVQLGSSSMSEHMYLTASGVMTLARDRRTLGFRWPAFRICDTQRLTVASPTPCCSPTSANEPCPASYASTTF